MSRAIHTPIVTDHPFFALLAFPRFPLLIVLGPLILFPVLLQHDPFRFYTRPSTDLPPLCPAHDLVCHVLSAEGSDEKVRSSDQRALWNADSVDTYPWGSRGTDESEALETRYGIASGCLEERLSV